MGEVTHLLDTHAVIWAYQDSNLLGDTARKIIAAAPPFSLAVSDITLLEIALLVSKQRLRSEIPLLELLQKIEKDYVVLPIRSAETAIVMTLQMPHADPFDRVIVATAHCQRLILVTKDSQITESDLVPVVW